MVPKGAKAISKAPDRCNAYAHIREILQAVYEMVRMNNNKKRIKLYYLKLIISMCFLSDGMLLCSAVFPLPSSFFKPPLMTCSLLFLCLVLLCFDWISSYMDISQHKNLEIKSNDIFFSFYFALKHTYNREL